MWVRMVILNLQLEYSPLVQMRRWNLRDVGFFLSVFVCQCLPQIWLILNCWVLKLSSLFFLLALVWAGSWPDWVLSFLLPLCREPFSDCACKWERGDVCQDGNSKSLVRIFSSCADEEVELERCGFPSVCVCVSVLALGLAFLELLSSSILFLVLSVCSNVSWFLNPIEY